MGRARAKVGEAVKESAGGKVRVGSSGFGLDVNLVLCKFQGVFFGDSSADVETSRYTPLDPYSADIFDSPLFHL